jgi:hypothetical protein
MPTSVTLIISVILAIVAAVVHFANIEHPVFPTRGFVLLLIAYLDLLLASSSECNTANGPCAR